MKWKRYRFTSTSDDNRPVTFNPAYPWWESGFDDKSSIIVAYLPSKEPLEKYWPEAKNVEYTDEKQIEFTSRFPQPNYYKPL
jgi:hypothetical protein